MSTRTNVELPLPFLDEGREAMVAFWWTSTLLKKASRRFFRRQGSSEAQFNLLMALKYARGPASPSDGPLTQNELSRRLLVDKSNVTGLLDRLEALGLIRRNEVANDRRSYHISLTDAGRKMTGKLEGPYLETITGIMSSFGKRDRRELIRLTRKLRNALAESDL